MAIEKKIILIIRNDTAANWSKVNSILHEGEAGYDTTNRILKIGDGVTNWKSLSSISGTGSSSGNSAPIYTGSLSEAYSAARKAGYNGSIDNLLRFVYDNRFNVISETPGMSWELLMELQGCNKFKNSYDIMNEIKDTYVDKSGNEYIQSWIVADFKVVTDSNGNRFNAAILQAKYAFPEVIQFDAPEPDNEDGSTYNDRKTYGNGNYSLSAVRQYINSAGNVGAWWITSHEFDIAPTQLSTIPGLLNGFSNDFINILKPVRNIIRGNNCGEERKLFVSYDKLWLPSLEEIYCVPHIALGIEGEYLSSWKISYTYYNNVTTRRPLYANYNPIVKNITNKSDNVNIWLRSSGINRPCNVFILNSSGAPTITNANESFNVAPVFALFK